MVPWALLHPCKSLAAAHLSRLPPPTPPPPNGKYSSQKRMPLVRLVPNCKATAIEVFSHHRRVPHFCLDAPKAWKI